MHMRAIDSQVYGIFLRDWLQETEAELAPACAFLQRLATAIPFDIIAGAFFLYSVSFYLLSLRMLDRYIILTGLGCVLAALSFLFANTGMVRKLRALSALVANGIFILML